MISRRRSVLFELAHYASQFRCRERRAPLYRHGRANAFQMRQKGPRASKSDGINLIKGCTGRIVASQFLTHLKLGRASCGERVWQNGLNKVVGGLYKKKR